MTPTTLLAFERRHPGDSPQKRELIRRMLGISEIRYAVLLTRAASSSEGIAADPITARRVREEADRRARERVQRFAA